MFLASFVSNAAMVKTKISQINIQKWPKSVKLPNSWPKMPGASSQMYQKHINAAINKKRKQ